MKKLFTLLLFMLLIPMSCFAAYPDLCQSLGCYKENPLTAQVMQRYGNWTKREAILMGNCETKPSLMELIRYAVNPDGTATKYVELCVVKEYNPKVQNSYEVNVAQARQYKLDPNGKVINARVVEVRAYYDMKVPNTNEFQLYRWQPNGDMGPKLIDEMAFDKVISAPPEEMDEDLTRFWNRYR